MYDQFLTIAKESGGNYDSRLTGFGLLAILGLELVVRRLLFPMNLLIIAHVSPDHENGNVDEPPVQRGWPEFILI
jgi:hypothetical protein